MSLKARIYLTALAFFAGAFLSGNPYPFEFMAASAILFVAGILINKKESYRGS